MMYKMRMQFFCAQQMIKFGSHHYLLNFSQKVTSIVSEYPIKDKVVYSLSLFVGDLCLIPYLLVRVASYDQLNWDRTEVLMSKIKES